MSLICLAVALPLAAQRTVAITFDDLPDINSDIHPVAVERAINAKLLEALKRNDLPAIGFVNEEQLEDDSVLQLWLAAGCELGNHTFAHSDFDAVTVEAAEDDILKGEAITRPLLASHNQPLVWFRHPFLDTGKTIDDRNAIDAFLTAHGYRVAPVTIDDSDWVYAYAYERAPPLVRPFIRNSYVRYLDRRFRFAEELSRRVFGREVAQVLLLHDSALNADACDEVAAMMRQRGYRGVTLDEALRDPAYATREEWAGGGVGWLERWGVERGIPTTVFEADPPVPRWIQFLAGPPS